MVLRKFGGKDWRGNLTKIKRVHPCSEENAKLNENVGCPIKKKLELDLCPVCAHEHLYLWDVQTWTYMQQTYNNKQNKIGKFEERQKYLSVIKTGEKWDDINNIILWKRCHFV